MLSNCNLLFHIFALFLVRLKLVSQHTKLSQAKKKDCENLHCSLRSKRNTLRTHSITETGKNRGYAWTPFSCIGAKQGPLMYFYRPKYCTHGTTKRCRPPKWASLLLPIRGHLESSSISSISKRSDRGKGGWWGERRKKRRYTPRRVRIKNGVALA